MWSELRPVFDLALALVDDESPSFRHPTISFFGVPRVPSPVDRADWPKPAAARRSDDGADADAGRRRHRRWRFRRPIGHGRACGNGAGHSVFDPDVQHRLWRHGRRCRLVDGAGARRRPAGRCARDRDSRHGPGSGARADLRPARLDLFSAAVRAARRNWSGAASRALFQPYIFHERHRRLGQRVPVGAAARQRRHGDAGAARLHRSNCLHPAFRCSDTRGRRLARAWRCRLCRCLASDIHRSGILPGPRHPERPIGDHADRDQPSSAMAHFSGDPAGRDDGIGDDARLKSQCRADARICRDALAWRRSPATASARAWST